mgnify:CR=1 FL=1
MTKTAHLPIVRAVARRRDDPHSIDAKDKAVAAACAVGEAMTSEGATTHCAHLSSEARPTLRSASPPKACSARGSGGPASAPRASASSRIARSERTGPSSLCSSCLSSAALELAREISSSGAKSKRRRPSSSACGGSDATGRWARGRSARGYAC